MSIEINRINLQILATYLAYGNGASKGIEFDMETFTRGSRLALFCKTAGCAVGFAPFAGIVKRETEDFGEYCDRALMDRRFPAWHWCFSEWWFDVDNTREGAAKRIQYFLNNGIPAGFDKKEITDKLVSLYVDTKVKKTGYWTQARLDRRSDARDEFRDHTTEAQMEKFYADQEYR